MGGGGSSLPSANPDNVAAGGATGARCGGGGCWRRERGGMKQITAHSNSYSSFCLSFFPLCIRRGFDEKILHEAVQNNYVTYIFRFISNKFWNWGGGEGGFHLIAL